MKRVALLGMPNTGKSTLFNRLTGSHARVGNWPGVTVDLATARVLVGAHMVELVDLPGLYDLHGFSDDEMVVRHFLEAARVDAVAVVLNSSQVDRQLALALQVKALELPTLVLLHTTVGIGYETPWRQVEAMLLLAAERTPGLLAEPRPFVLQRALGDFCVTYELNAATDTPQRMLALYDLLHRNILDVFNEHAVQIMTPAYVADTPVPKVVPREQWHLAPAARVPDGTSSGEKG